MARICLRLPRWLILSLALALANCNSSSTTSVTGPTLLRCSIALAGPVPTVEGAGGTGRLNVTVNRECTWSAKSEVEWITVTPDAGQGDAELNYRVAANPSGAQRKGAVVVNEQRAEVTQAAACIFTVAPQQAVASANEEQLTITVSAPVGCAWTAASQANWISVSSGATGSGSGSTNVLVAANTGPPRTGTVLIAGVTYTIDQRQAGGPEPPAPGPPPPGPGPTPPGPGPTCVFALSETSQSIGVAGGSGSVGVVTTAECTWTSTSSAPWLTIVSGSSGVGGGTVQFSVAPNGSAARTGTLTIAGLVFTLTQAGSSEPPPCAFTVAPATVDAPAGGLTSSVTLTASAPTCPWTASSSASWIVLTSPASGTGNSAVTFSVAENASASVRTGTLTVGGRTVTVNQAAGPTVVTLSGAISSLQGSCPTVSFTVSGRAVTTTAATEFRGGSCASLQNGRAVTVEGLVQPDNSVLANWVRKD